MYKNCNVVTLKYIENGVKVVRSVRRTVRSFEKLLTLSQNYFEVN